MTATYSLLSFARHLERVTFLTKRHVTRSSTSVTFSSSESFCVYGMLEIT